MFGQRVNFKPFSRPAAALALEPPSSSSSASWPESLGFVLWGSGPSFVIHVEPWSPLAREIAPGDQIAGVDDIADADRLSAAALKAAVASRRSNRQTIRGETPALRVVSRTKQIQIAPTKKWRYGFTVRGALPVQVNIIAGADKTIVGAGKGSCRCRRCR